MHLSWQHFERTLAHELLLKGPDDHHAGFIGFTVDGVTISPNSSDLITLSDGNGINLTGTTSTVTFDLAPLTAAWNQSGNFAIKHFGDITLYSDSGLSTQTATWDEATGHINIGTGAVSAANAIRISKEFTDITASILSLAGNIGRSVSAAPTIIGIDGTLSSVATSAGITMTGTHTSFLGKYLSAAGSAHTVDDYRSFTSQMVIFASRGDVVNRYGFRFLNKTGGGNVTNQYAFYSDAITSGTALNYFIYALGGLSVHVGPWRFGSVTTPTNTTDGDLTATRLIVPDATLLHSAVSQLGGPVVVPTGGQIRFSDADDSNYVGLRAPAVAPAADLVIHLPSDTPSAGEVLTVTAVASPDVTTEWAAGGGGSTDLLSERASQVVAAGTTITVTDGVPVTPFTTGSGSNITSTATPFIAAGRDGQFIILRNDNGTDAAGLILSDTNYLANSNMRLDADTLTLAGTSVSGWVYSDTLSSWVFQWYKKLKHYDGAINSFVMSGSAGSWESGNDTAALTHEWGDGVTVNDTAPTFTAAYTGIPTAASVTITASPDTGYPLTLTTPFLTGSGNAYFRGATAGSTRTFRLSATVNGSALTSDAVVTYRAPNYAGASSTATGIADATLIAFSDRQLDTNALGTHSITTAASEYIWFACPSSYSTPVFYKTSDQELVGFTLDATSAHVGAYANSSTYKKFVSVTTNLGSGGAFAFTVASSGGLLRNWFGASASVTNEATIEALSGSLLDSNAISSMGSIGSAGGQYLWFCFPSSYTDPAYFVNSTNSIRALFTVQATAVALTNQYGYAVSGGYDIFRSAIADMPTKTYASTSSRPANSRFVGASAAVTTSAHILALSSDTADITESPNGTWQGITGFATTKKMWWCASNTNNGGAPTHFGMAQGSPGTSSSVYEEAKFTANAAISFTNNYGYTENYYNYSSDVQEWQAVEINNATSSTWSLKTQAALFPRRVFCGPHAATAITSPQILTIDDTASGVSVLLDQTVAGSYVVTVSGSDYLWFCHPSGTDIVTIKDNSTGFAIAGSYRTNVTSHTSDTGETGLTMRVWRSDNVGIFPTGGTVVVT